jgi:hypothetical protein
VERDTLIMLAVVILAFVVVTDLLQLWWVARTQNPDRGPRDRNEWARTTVADLRPGDVILSSALSSRPETVISISPTEDGQIRLAFRSGRSRTVDRATPVRRHREPTLPS